MRMSRGGRGGNRRWMMRRVMSLCRGGSGCSGSKYGTGGRGSLGREWRDHRCGYRGGLLTRQHRRCNTYTYTVCRLIIVSPFQRERKKKKERERKKKYDRSYARSIVRTSYRRTGENIESTLAAAVRAIRLDSRSSQSLYSFGEAPPTTPPSFALLAHSAVVYRCSRYSTAQV